jgi:hypothetical protein
MAGNSGPNIVNDGLVLYLDASNSQSYSGSGNTWFDLSGKDNHATLTNSPSFSTNNNGYFSFNGTNQYGLISDSSTLSFTNNIFTFDFWVYFNNISIGGIIGKMSPWEYAFRFTSNGILGLPTWNLAGTQVYFSNEINTTVVANAWYNIIYTADGSNSYLYRNNVYVATRPKTVNTMGDGSSPVYIGAGGDSEGIKYLNGFISNFKIYNRFFTSADVDCNYKATKSRFNLS